MAFSKVDEVYVSFADGGTANGSTGHDIVGVNGTTALAGDVDVLIVGSDTTVTTPSGFSVASTFVNNQGGYLFERVCTGGESATVRVKTTGDFNTTAMLQRWRGAGTRDVALNSHVDSSGALVSNAINSGTLATATELVIVGSVMTDSVSAAPTTPVWSTGYTPGDGGSSIGTGSACSAGFMSHKNPAGTAAETPQVSWSPDNMRNRYTFLISYRLGSGTPVTITDSSGGAGAGTSADQLAIGVVKQDASGGTSPGGSNETPAIGVTIADTSGGSSPGSSTDTLVTGRTITDSSGGAAAGASGDVPAFGVVLTDSSGGASPGGTADQAVNGTFIQDGSGGAGAGASADSLSSGIVLTDTSGGAGAGASSQTVSVGTLITDSSGGASGGTSADTVSSGGAGPVTIQDTSGGATAASSAYTVQSGSGVVQDTMVMPVLANALNCLMTEENKAPVPVAQYMIRPGQSFAAMADSVADECCSGIGWVRPGPMWESDDFPNQRTTPTRTDAAYYSITIEVGLMRCAPTVSNVLGSNDAVPTAAQWLAATQAAMDDAAALRRVVCCLRDIYGNDAVISAQINPYENEGNCMGQAVVLTLRVPACDCEE